MSGVTRPLDTPRPISVVLRGRGNKPRLFNMESGLQVINVSGKPSQVYVRRSILKESSSLILVISGSPGIAQYYIPFADRLYEDHDRMVDVCVLGHLGHSPGLHNDQSRDWFSLEDQLAHKLAFLDVNYPQLGHSIGCYVILHMLQSCVHIEKAILLFPTIERMAESVNGKKFLSFSIFLQLAIFCHWLTTLLPVCIRRNVLQFWFSDTPAAQREHMIDATLAINNTGLYNIFNMAGQEMKVVSQLPTDIIEQYLNKLVFCYSTDDKWVPPDCFSKILDMFPEGDIVQCDCAHAFVLTASDEIANFCYNKLDTTYT